MDGLKSFLFFNELSQQEVADYLGVSKGQMSKLVSGNARLQPEQLMKLLSNPNGWNTEFLTGHIWAELESGKSAAGLKNKIVQKEPQQEEKLAGRLPLIPFEAVAGPGRPIYEDERIGEYYYVSEFKECDFLIRVKGDSMAPHFVGGDLLACRKVVDAFFFQWGRCYVVYTRSQGVMVKRVQPSEKEGWITCVSDNPKYAPFDVPLEDVVSVALVNGSISLE